ncbi:DUF1826 domain-containing protein [Ruegeria sp. 2205SS24-7]|uniref:DUF1826 domain-containing protein n=1 Tax=Ruegeria discodermiae TaxID=3064389 RepID=UPI002741D306|nr:DUF1826 domain-containing protein [Ruegeria sp. 2205SS24-7]MDP5220464.1 DUF1826 domain-containing protein [Ruegeria sp. 2205SS24-7]
MSYARAEIKNPAVGVGVTDTPDGLARISQPGCAATLWRRQLASEFQSWINALDPSKLPKARLVLRPDAVKDAVRHLCDIKGIEDVPERAWLEEDISDLTTRFAEMMRAPYLRLRLDVITTDACRKFHIDAIHARLICTYRGTGTQYGVSPDGEDPKRVFTVGTGAPMVLRGTLWPQNPPSGLLHRSPPIAGTGETRLVLVLDPVFDTDEVD